MPIITKSQRIGDINRSNLISACQRMLIKNLHQIEKIYKNHSASNLCDNGAFGDVGNWQ